MGSIGIEPASSGTKRNSSISVPEATPWLQLIRGLSHDLNFADFHLLKSEKRKTLLGMKIDLLSFLSGFYLHLVCLYT